MDIINVIKKCTYLYTPQNAFYTATGTGHWIQLDWTT